ncbi:MAG: flippase-like domain-containing protein [Thermoplasmata archaeon]|nr:MAG: flippase-like domain-containing protein [Thermoplasmata archaeon]
MKIKSSYLGIVGILVLIYILLNINLSKVVSILKSADLFFLGIAILINVVVISLLTIRWKYIIHTMGVEVNFKLCLILRLKGSFLGNITPGKIGDLYRAKHLSEETDFELAKSFSSVIIDRILDISALIFLNILGLYILLFVFEIKTFWIEYIIFSFLILIGLFLIIKKNLMRKLLKPIYKVFVPMDARQNIVMHFNEFYMALAKIKLRNYLFSFIISIAVWIAGFIGIYFLALSLSISVSLIFIISMAACATFISALPISIGGLGTREAVYVFFLSSIGIESEYSVALSLMVFIFLNLIYVPVGIASYLIFK